MKLLKLLLTAIGAGALLYEIHRLVEYIAGPATIVTSEYIFGGPEDLDFELKPEEEAAFDEMIAMLEADLKKLSDGNEA